MSIAREHAARASAAPALLVYSARTWDDVIFRDELLAARAAGRTLGVVLVTTREDPHPGIDRGGRLDAAALAGILAHWAHTPARAYVCGSNRFVEAIATALVDVDFAPARIRTERYGGSSPG
jgi:ferredoxin-NADP reductase